MKRLLGSGAIYRMVDMIRSLTHSIPPAVYNLTAILPSLKDLQTSVDKLRELCIPCKSTFCYL